MACWIEPFLKNQYAQNTAVHKEIDNKPVLERSKLIYEDAQSLVGIASLGLLAPFLMLLIVMGTFPIWIIYFIMRWYYRNKAVEQLRMTDAFITRVIMMLRLSEG